MQIIPLTRGYAIVDDELWLPLITLGRWYFSAKGYAVRSKSRVNGKRPQVYMHREALRLAGHDLTGLEVDHKSGDKLDNRIANLRPATTAGKQLQRA